MPILDTDILISFLRNKSPAVQYITELTKKKQSLKTTIFNVAELYSGVYLSSNIAREIRILEAFIKTLEVLGFESESSIVYGQISADLQKRGNPIGVMDELIGSIVIQNDETLITANIKHFKEIPHLNYQNWKLNK
ncbi:MAG: type II toxin-antitoxin system VapC family toxin [Promethearchaeota archaeon]|nr:MAG: type II toxin-antitoxin system VapC family toxin [Candidatus Lokiarchaeota archaeon]